MYSLFANYGIDIELDETHDDLEFANQKAFEQTKTYQALVSNEDFVRSMQPVVAQREVFGFIGFAKKCSRESAIQKNTRKNGSKNTTPYKVRLNRLSINFFYSSQNKINSPSSHV